MSEELDKPKDSGETLHNAAPVSGIIRIGFLDYAI